MPGSSNRPPDLPAAQLQVIANWRGLRVPEHMRLKVVPFARSAVALAGPAPVSAVGQRLRATAALAVASLEDGMPLNIELIFDPENVDRQMIKGARDGVGTAATYRAVLRKMGPLVTKKAPWSPPLRGLPRRSLAEPYPPAQERRYERARNQQSTSIKSRHFAVAISLGFGAGLDGRTIPIATAGQCIWVRGILCVDVNKPSPRRVPVIKHYWPVLLDLLDGLDDNDFILTGSASPLGKNFLSDALADLDLPKDLPTFNACRARSTWLTRLLAKPIPLPELLAAAGIRGTTSLVDLVPFLPPLPAETALKLLSQA